MKENSHNRDNNKRNSANTESDQLVLDQLVFERLVDDELSDAEYREVLRLVEEKPDGWRQLALAFLESQALEKELSAWDLGTGSALVEQAGLQQAMDSSLSSPEQQGQLSDAGRSQRPAGLPKVASVESLHPKPKFGLARALPAIAACFAIAFAAGLYLREIQNSNSGQVSSAENANLSTAGQAVPAEYIELVSNDSDGRVKTPVYSHQKFDPRRYANEVKALKPALQKVVEQPGWSANEKTHMVPIKDQTGNKIIVPLKEIKLTPRKFEDYQ